MADVVPDSEEAGETNPRPKLVHQFLVVLSGTDPLVGAASRCPRIIVWDLHVAIQDAMGWQDYHLHEFRLLDAAEHKVVSIGIPTDDDLKIALSCPGGRCPYLSSSIGGTGTLRPRHMRTTSAMTGSTSSFMRASSQRDDRKYPRCTAGEGRCPPEDCGGVHGYAEFLQVIADPDHEEHESTLRWAGGQFDPEAFDPATVKFDDPKKRWKKAFERRS